MVFGVFRVGPVVFLIELHLLPHPLPNEKAGEVGVVPLPFQRSGASETGGVVVSDCRDKPAPVLEKTLVGVGAQEHVVVDHKSVFGPVAEEELQPLVPARGHPLRLGVVDGVDTVEDLERVKGMLVRE